MTELEEIERRVGQKWLARAVHRQNLLWGSSDPTLEWDMPSWDLPEAPAGWPQFPRDQWAALPNNRIIALMIAERMLDFDDMTDEQWHSVCLLMQYGGKTRLA